MLKDQLAEALDACAPFPLSGGDASTIQMVVSCPNGAFVAVRIDGRVFVRRVATLEPQDQNYTSADDGKWYDSDEPPFKMLQWRPA